MQLLSFSVNPCNKANGGCAQICRTVADVAVCGCRRGFVLAADNVSCEKVHPCDQANKGGCSQLCIRKGDVAVCGCSPGFTLDEDKATCNRVHPCDRGNGGCAHICKKINAAAICRCHKGFNLGVDKVSCKRVHPCDEGSKGPCSHLCIKKGKAAVCECNPGFRLAADRATCKRAHPCDQANRGGCSQLCLKNGDHAFCWCRPGFSLDKDEVTCLKVHPCDQANNGGCSQVCIKKGDLAVCGCKRGFTLAADKVTCRRVHPCDQANKGGCSQVCIKKGDLAVCGCKRGFTLDADKVTCKKVHPCDQANKGSCSQLCIKKGDGAMCGCKKGYILGEDKISCNKVHPCDQSSKGGCSQLCIKEGEGAVCKCKAGFELDADDTSCKKACTVQTEGGACCDFPYTWRGVTYSTTCTPVDHIKPWCYTNPEHTQWGECEVVHPCDQTNKGGCSQLCIKKGAFAACGCNTGFVLDEDKLNCKKAYRCTFVSGDGIGGSEKRIGSQTGDHCIHACLSMQKNDRRVNGVTVRKDGKDGCYCEIGMRKVASSKTYKTCFLSEKVKAYNCTFVSGDGTGGSERRIGSQTGDDCIHACLSMQKNDRRVNGVTVRKNGKGGCWCEMGMRKVAPSKTYKTCFLTEKVKGHLSLEISCREMSSDDMTEKFSFFVEKANTRHDDYMCFALDTKCAFVSGDGTGGSEKRIGSQTGDDCIHACLSLQKNDKRVNGVTVRKDGKDGCYCEMGMKKVAPSKTYKTCFLTNNVKLEGQLLLKHIIIPVK